ncbi:hypothetical protein [Paenibacillus mesotrionivorans]|uniref:Uncharacterized protein n=1 Tax=Paenibacillus mesotrionivorans TaxID=3160968 RepID=A0ACC7P5M8_9BACL
MEITNSPPFSIPKLYHFNKQSQEAGQSKGQLVGLPNDTVSISPEGRQLAADAITHEPAKYYGTAEINGSLTGLLADKDPKVGKAVYTIIESNFMPDGTVSKEEDRAALLEAGLAQAQYIADHYMNGEESSQFMDTMNQIAAIAKTRTVDPATGQASYTTPADRPAGAPEDYVSAGDLLKRFEPDTYTKLQEAITGGGDWGSILIGFAKRVPQHTDWTETYLKEEKDLAASLKNTKHDNRFESADTSDLAAFTKGMKDLIQSSVSGNRDLLNRNLQYFAHILK